MSISPPSDSTAVNIAGRSIAASCAPYIVAEMSANHLGSYQRAEQLMQAAAAAGAHAVKLQTYTADTITIDHDGPDFQISGGLWAGRNLYDLYQEASTPWEWHASLFALGRRLGLTVFSSPFDESAVEFLEELGAPAYKIASFEAIDLPLIRCAASTGKPLIISTGMANLDEIEAALDTARSAGCRQLVLLHCVSGYPTPAEEYNVRTVPDLRQRFGVPVGLSDHTLGTAVAVAAVSLGAVMVEKHYTLRRDDGGPDAAFSLEPSELRTLCEDTLAAWRSLGSPNYERTPAEQANVAFRRSLYVVADVPAGGVLDSQCIRSIRPGYGLPPARLDDLLGRRASRDLRRGEPLAPGMFLPDLET